MTTAIDSELARRLAELIRPAIDREYPHKPARVLGGAADVGPHRDATPIFFGCFDWHSAVHSHWSLARLARLVPDAPWAAEIRDALAGRFTAARVEAEVESLRAQPGFELPYGIAWLLALDAELALGASKSRAVLAPLADLAAERFAGWLEGLPAPIRSGEHSQSAFAMTLAFDAARATGRDALAEIVADRALAFYAGDRDAPIDYEPSAHDFLSPSLGEAALMSRVLGDDFAAWLDVFLPRFDLPPVAAADRSSGKLVHWDGLCSSRAWMLASIAAALSPQHPRRDAFATAAELHRDAGVDAAFSPHYAGAHWLGTFALRALTGP